MATRLAALAASSTLLAGGGAALAGNHAGRAVLVVPDVRHQAYIVAQGVLEDGGFAWHVSGSVQGFAANPVVAQDPQPGTRVVDTGAPTIVLRLAQKGARKGVAANASPYVGTALRLAELAAATAPTSKPSAPAGAAAAPLKRLPDFRVAGAPAEPQNEIPLTQRANLLLAWAEGHPPRTRANVSHWLYQHSWVVTGAGFGWWHGAEALKTLIEVDRHLQRTWGLGARSEALARDTLAQVQAPAR